MNGSPSTAIGRIVVGFRGHSSSLAALRWAIEAAHAGSRPLRVVHATDAGVVVCNGPSRAVAHNLGDPDWATVHSLVQGLGAPRGTETIIKTGDPAEVLASFVEANDILVLGERRRFWPGRNLQRILQKQCGCAVLRIGDSTAPHGVLAPNDERLSEV